MGTEVNVLQKAVPILLLAEDDPDQSDMLREVLQDEGYRVDTAFCGEEALHKLLNQHFDLVILDIRLPGLSGLDVLGTLRTLPGKAPVPAIVVSAFATAYDCERYKTAGASACIVKPYALDDVLKSVSALLVSQKGKVMK